MCVFFLLILSFIHSFIRPHSLLDTQLSGLENKNCLITKLLLCYVNNVRNLLDIYDSFLWVFLQKQCFYCSKSKTTFVTLKSKFILIKSLFLFIGKLPNLLDAQHNLFSHICSLNVCVSKTYYFFNSLSFFL